MKASKVLVTLLLSGLVLSTGCSSTSKGVSTEGNSVKVDFAPLLTVDQPKPVIEAGPKVPFNPVLDDFEIFCVASPKHMSSSKSPSGSIL